MSGPFPLPLIVLGGGGHARVLIDALRLAGARIEGICDPALDRGNPGPFGLAALGGNEALDAFPGDSVLLVNGIGSTHDLAPRRRMYELFAGRGYRFATVVHPAAVLAAEVRLDEGAQVMAGAVIQTGTTVGRNAIVNTGASVDHDCRIGNHVHIAPAAALSGGVVVGEASHVGIGAAIIQAVKIGRECVVGAGTVVLGDVPDGATVVTPAIRTTPRDAR